MVAAKSCCVSVVYPVLFRGRNQDARGSIKRTHGEA